MTPDLERKVILEMIQRHGRPERELLIGYLQSEHNLNVARTDYWLNTLSTTEPPLIRHIPIGSKSEYEITHDGIVFLDNLKKDAESVKNTKISIKEQRKGTKVAWIIGIVMAILAIYGFFNDEAKHYLKSVFQHKQDSLQKHDKR